MDVLNPIRCLHCESAEIVKTAQMITRVIYFCLNCGRTFEIKPPAASARV
jgi:DNA-directed RNA polymerase subunit RPC12/RpoP